MTSEANGPFLAQVSRSVRSQRRAMDRALNNFSASAPADCLLALDTQELQRPGERFMARNVIYHRGWRLAFMIATNVGDHLSAVADVASADPPRVFAHMTLARAALEGAARVCYLLHPGGTLEDRVLRGAALLMASAEEEQKAISEMATWNPSVHAAARSRHSDIAGLLAQAGIETRRGRNGVRLLGVMWPGSSELVESSPNVSALLRDLVPDKPAAYRIGSGALHSQPWVLDDESAYDMATRRLNWQLDPAALSGSVDLAITASKLVLNVFATMLGCDPSKELIEAQRREEAVARIAAALLAT